jgi:V/A-type H+-transporting ATPase subunit D
MRDSIDARERRGRVESDGHVRPRSGEPRRLVMQRLSATRSELLARRAGIRLAGERDLLKERRGALVHEFNRLGASALASIDLLDRDAADAGRFLGMTVAADGQEPVESAACAAQREVEPSLKTRSVAGVPIVEPRQRALRWPRSGGRRPRPPRWTHEQAST